MSATNLPAKAVKLIDTAGITPDDIMTVVNDVIDKLDEWNRVRETERTRRAEIAAQEAATVAEIRAKRDVFLTYLNRSFDERERNFTELFKALDRAATEGTQDVTAILTAITALAAKSPFADLRNIEMVKENLADPDHEWTV